MNDETSSPEASLPIAVLERIDRVCLDFEAAWKEGRSPRIEEYLGETQSAERAALLRELLRLELDYRRQAGEQPSLSEYQVRFSRAGELVDEVFEEYVELAASTPPPGTRIRYFGDYELLEELGRGGMGIVYKARQMSLNRIVALKMILARRLASEMAVKRFRAEAELAANLQHSGIVAIHEVGEHDGQHYFSMDYIEGKSLAEMVRESPLTPRKAAWGVQKIAEAVHYAHKQGTLHRDLKPSNVLLDRRGQLKVTDFGLAKRLESDSELTGTGEILGTPCYMSPEQAKGKHEAVGPASDVYSLGAILYECLTARPPFRAATPVETLRQVIDMEPVSPRLLNPRVPRDLETICLKCLQKEPNKRYRKSRLLAEDLGRYLKGKPIEARPIGRIARAWRWCRRKPLVAGLMAGIAALVFAASVIIVFEERRVRTERDRAVVEAEKARTEAAISQAVLDFLNQDLLAQADPREEPDRDIKLRTVLDRASKRIQNRFAGQPLVEAKIRWTLGIIYLSVGEYADAEIHLKRALEIYRRERGNEHIDTLAAIDGLASGYYFQGRNQQAEKLRTEALQVLNRTLGPEHPITLSHMHNLANVYCAESRYEEAEKLHTQALQSRRRVLGSDHPDTLVSMDSLSLVYALEGRYHDAEKLQTQVLGISCRRLGQEHSQTLTAMKNLALTRTYQGRYEEAEKLYMKVLEIDRRTLGPEHPLTLSTLHNLALVYEKQNRYDQAEKLNVEVLETRLRTLRPEHPDTLKSMHNLAKVYIDERRYEQAEKLLAELLEIDRRTPGLEHSDALCIMAHLAEVYSGQGRLEDAEKSYAQVVEISRHTLGPEHPETLGSMHNLANCYGREERYEEAEKLHTQVLKIRRRTLGPDHPETLSSMDSLAIVYNEQGRYEEAKNLLTDLVKADPTSVRALNALARLLSACPDPRVRDPDRAVTLANRAVQLAPKSRAYWNTLGIARYRAEDWNRAVAALEKSVELRSGGCCCDWLFLAMAHWQLGQKEVARKWYDKAIAWIDEKGLNDEEHLRFRAEAEALITGSQEHHQSLENAEKEHKSAEERAGHELENRETRNET